MNGRRVCPKGLSRRLHTGSASWQREGILWHFVAFCGNFRSEMRPACSGNVQLPPTPTGGALHLLPHRPYFVLAALPPFTANVTHHSSLPHTTHHCHVPSQGCAQQFYLPGVKRKRKNVTVVVAVVAVVAGVAVGDVAMPAHGTNICNAKLGPIPWNLNPDF